MNVSRRTFFRSVSLGAAGAALTKPVSAASVSAPATGPAQPLAQEHTNVFHNPDPERYVEGCGLVRMADNTFVAVVPVVPRVEWSEARRATQSRTHIVQSTDGGRTWK